MENKLHINNLEKCPRELLDYTIQIIKNEKERREKELMKEMPKTEGYHD